MKRATAGTCIRLAAASILPLLSACGAYQTPGVTPVRSRLASVTTASGTAVIFDTLPAPQISHDTIYGRQGGVPCAIPTSDVAETRWAAASGEQAATLATASNARPADLDMESLAQGAHVRITAPSLGWYGATKDVNGVRGDTLLVRRAGGFLGLILSPRPVPMSAVSTLEVSRNHAAHFLAVLGGDLAGVYLGIRVGIGLSSCRPEPGLDFHCLGSDMASALLGGVVGGALGALLASAIVPERWVPAGLPRPRVGLELQSGRRMSLGVSLAF